MIALNLPSYNYSVKNIHGKAVIFDVIRRKFVALTPEEWVRQHWIHYLTESLGYPSALLGVEISFVVEGLRKRFDLAACSRSGQPIMLVECKAPDVALSPDVFDQLAVYHQTLQARYLVLSNGLKHYCLEYQSVNGSYRLIQQIPSWGEVMGEE